MAWSYANAARRWAPVAASPYFGHLAMKQQADAAEAAEKEGRVSGAAAQVAHPPLLASPPGAALGAVPVIGETLSTVGGAAGGLTG